MIIGDFGTSYSKILDLAQPEQPPKVIPTRRLPPEMRVDLATGHNARRFSNERINELTALARGGEALIKKPDFLLLDCGSRDLKFIRYQEGRMRDMGWNAECGASMGFTIELLERYYQLDCRQMLLPERGFSVTCGVLGLSDIFDAVVGGMPEAEAVACLIKGIADNAYRFASQPEELYLSGGLCENPVFVASFPCRVHSLGRFVLLAGLTAEAARRGLAPVPAPAPIPPT